MVNSKFHLIQIFYEVSVYIFELTVPNLYMQVIQIINTSNKYKLQIQATNTSNEYR